MQILSSGQHEHIISWTPDGLSFVVKKPSLLVSEVLPHYFKEVKYSSFTRKLHRWGFVKILRGKELSAYFHKIFLRGNFELCAQMNCSKSGGSGALADVPHHVQKNILPRMHDNIHDMHDREVLHEQMLREQLAREQMAFNSIPRLHQESGYHGSRFPNNSHYYRNAAPLPMDSMAGRPVMPHQQFMNEAPDQQRLPMNTSMPRFNTGHENFGMNRGMPSLPAPGANNLPGPNNLELERARHSFHHRRIMEDAWNALSFDSKARGGQETGPGFQQDFRTAGSS